MKKALLVVAFLFGGCAALKPETVQIDPVSIVVSKAVETESQLTVDARLTALVPVETGLLDIKLSGVKAGEVQKSSTIALSEVVPENILPDGESALVSISIPKGDYDEFQVTASWGNKIIPTREFVQDLELVDLEFVEDSRTCSGVVCERRVTVKGALDNQTASKFEEAKIAVGIQWVKDGQKIAVRAQSSEPYPDEQVLEIGSLSSGDRRSFVIELEKSLPELPGGSFEPTVRLLSPEK